MVLLLGVKKLLVITVDLSGVPRKKYFNKKHAVMGDFSFWEIPLCILMKYQSASLEFSWEIEVPSASGKGSVQYNFGEEPQS